MSQLYLLSCLVSFCVSINVPYPIKVLKLSNKINSKENSDFLNDIKQCLDSPKDRNYSSTDTPEARNHFSIINKAILRYQSLNRPPYNNCEGPFLENEFIKRYKNHTLSYFSPFIPLFVPWFSIWKNNEKSYQKIISEILELLKPEYLYFVLSESDFGFTGAKKFIKNLPSNILVFSASGMGHVAVPWLQCHHSPPPKALPEYFLSFCGNPRSSGERKETLNMVHALLGSDFYECRDDHWEEVIQKSLFVLAPRGIAVATYRTFEVIQMEAIPVIFTDHVHWLPYFPKLNWSKFSILTNVPEFPRTALRLRTMELHEILEMKKALHEANINFFQWEGFFNQLDAFFEGGNHYFSCSKASLTFP